MTRKLGASFFVLIGILLAGSGSAWAQVTLADYDLFATPTINPDKWIGLEFSQGPSNTEVTRRILSSQAQLLLRATGNTTSDTGVTNSSNRLRVGHRALLTGTPRITAMDAKMMVSGASVETCPGNLSTSRARAQLFGVFFNDGTGNTRAGDRTGDVSAGVHKVMDSVLGNRVEAFVQRCTDPACTTSASVVTAGTAFTRSWSVGDTDLMRIVWNAAANNFVFTASRVPSGPSETVMLSYAVADAAPAKRWFNDVAIASSMANCMASSVTTFMDLRVDNVRLNSSAVAVTLP